MTLFVLGNSAVDIFYEVPHLPRPGETLLAAGESDDLGGKGLNQAIMANVPERVWPSGARLATMSPAAG